MSGEEGSGPASGALYLESDDPLVARQVEAFARARKIELASDAAGGPGLMVIDVQRPGALERIESLRQAWPDTVIVGHLSLPDRRLWEAAEKAGCDVVASRGALRRHLERLAAEVGPEGEVRRHRYPLADSADVAGRLGLVRALDATPVGPVGLYHVGGQLYALGDVCPHAGACLSEGMLDGPTLTCPRHGSQFDVTSGQRVRGPADQAIATYSVVEVAGRVYLVWA